MNQLNIIEDYCEQKDPKESLNFMNQSFKDDGIHLDNS